MSRIHLAEEGKNGTQCLKSWVTTNKIVLLQLTFLIGSKITLIKDREKHIFLQLQYILIDMYINLQDFLQRDKFLKVSGQSTHFTY